MKKTNKPDPLPFLLVGGDISFMLILAFFSFFLHYGDVESQKTAIFFVSGVVILFSIINIGIFVYTLNQKVGKAIVKALLILVPNFALLFYLMPIFFQAVRITEYRSQRNCMQRIGQGADLFKCNLIGVNLSGANLSGANLSMADLSNSILVGANFSGANLSDANLTSADLSEAILDNADLTRAILVSTNFTEASVNDSIFDNTDPIQVIGLSDEMISVIASWKIPDLNAFCQRDTHRLLAAKRYTLESTGIHPLAANFSADLPGEWIASDVRDIELVLCEQNVVAHVDTCRYLPGGKIERYQFVLIESLYEAQTGELVNQHRYSGPEPRNCPGIYPADPDDIYGDLISVEDRRIIRNSLEEWLIPWVNPMSE